MVRNRFWGPVPKIDRFFIYFLKSRILRFLAKTEIFSDRHPSVSNHEKTWPMFQLRVVVISVQKVICVVSTVWASTQCDDRFLKFLIQLIDMKVEFLKIEFLDLIAYF